MSEDSATGGGGMTTVAQRGAARRELNERLRDALVAGLELPIDPVLFDFDQPLFGRGLELDSLDTLEIVSIVEEEFGAFIVDQDRFVFGSVNRLVDFIESANGAGG
ncbi:MAG: acyl carrier protein [Frankiaceae bacterium]|jgi:acyl carrier protein|nr:acyl carrier protein [Frankiaceae bacterium]